MSARTRVAGTSTTNRTGASESTGSAVPSLIARGGVSRCCANARVVQAPDDGVAISVSISIRPLVRTAESKLLRHWRLQYRCRCPPVRRARNGRLHQKQHAPSFDGAASRVIDTPVYSL